MSSILSAPSSILKPSGGLYLNTLQVGIPNWTETLVLLDTIMTGFEDGIEDTGNRKITPGVAGLYLISARIAYRQLTAGNNYAQMIVYVNGTTKISYPYKQIADGASTSNLSIYDSVLWWLNSTDYLTLVAIHDCGNADPDVMPGIEFTYLQAQLLRKG